MSTTSIEKNKPPPDTLPFVSILDNIGEGIQIIDAEWNIFYTNQAAAELGGKVAAEIQGKNVWAEFPELVGSYIELTCRRAMREQVRIDFEFHFASRDKWLEIHLHPTPQYLALYVTEITGRIKHEIRVEHLAEIEDFNVLLRRTNEALVISSVRQHELTEHAQLLNARLHLAMQDAHHRITNNLQVISALVEMQGDEYSATASDEHLKRIKQHIGTLATIHDLLTQQAKDDSEVEYLSARAMGEQIVPLLQQASGGRRITAEIADVLLPIQQATSLCLLISECVSNAVKHSIGGIDITLRVEGEKARLEICDDGGGFPLDFDWQKEAHTGLTLIDGTARYDLRGQVRFENHSTGGGRVAVTFPIQGRTQNALP